MRRSDDEARESGLTLIEVIIVLVIIAILIMAATFAYRQQLAKARDARRKADLSKLQKMLEDYLNDNLCYPDSLPCGPTSGDLVGYLSALPCDPINSASFNYLYTYDTAQTCKRWYKIYAKLENDDDPVIEKVGCVGGCGPANNFSYWVSSPNISESGQLPGEYWPVLGASFPPGPYECFDDLSCNVACGSVETACGACCPGTAKECLLVESEPRCCYTQECPK